MFLSDLKEISLISEYKFPSILCWGRNFRRELSEEYFSINLNVFKKKKIQLDH